MSLTVKSFNFFKGFRRPVTANVPQKTDPVQAVADGTQQGASDINNFLKVELSDAAKYYLTEVKPMRLPVRLNMLLTDIGRVILGRERKMLGLDGSTKGAEREQK